MFVRPVANPRSQSSNRRSTARARIGLPARLETVAGPRPVILQNVSVTGAMIEAAGLPPVGKDVIIKCGNLDVLAMVIWADKGRCGLAFDDPADGAEIVRLRYEGDEAARAHLQPGQIGAKDDWETGFLR